MIITLGPSDAGAEGVDGFEIAKGCLLL